MSTDDKKCEYCVAGSHLFCRAIRELSIPCCCYLQPAAREAALTYLGPADDPLDPLTYLNQCVDLFKVKSEGYAKTGQLLANFFNSPPVTHKFLTPFQYAAVLVSKQDDAVWSYITDPTPRKKEELVERLKDGITYRAIMLALLEEEKTR